MKNLPVIYRKSLQRFGVATGLGVLIMTLLSLLGIIFQLLVGSQIHLDGSFMSWYSTSLGIAYFVWAVLYLTSSYSDFKLGAQSGQTRLRVWFSELASIVTTTLALWILSSLSLAVSGHLVLNSRLAMLTVLFAIISFIFAIGSGFALLPRKWKIVVAIALPTLAIFLMVQLVRILVHLNPSQATMQVLGNIFTWPGTAYLIGWLFILIMFALSYVFTMRMQLRRD